MSLRDEIRNLYHIATEQKEQRKENNISKIKIGWSEISITPEKKIYLQGQFAERISQYIEKPLTATAMAIENGDDHVIMCSCDLGGTSWGLRQLFVKDFLKWVQNLM